MDNHQTEPSVANAEPLDSPAALGDLYALYSLSAYSVILRIVRDNGVAEDLVQETFLRALSRAGLFDLQKGPFKPWLLKVAQNLALDYLRISNRRRLLAIGPMTEQAFPKFLTHVDDRVAELYRVNSLAGALRKLSVNQREVIELAYFDGLSQTEIASKLGRPLGTVKSWARSAIRELRAELEVRRAN